ncbi:S9 family peptidase [Wenzhouxiangella marina]|uniref:Prolyl oligopeptidase family protein n=1 Tax=Wenzhouxiangella marina TaxID=1579979 RepID=A0A0K0XV03_9GAMM|nr:prolyl oligopeptidase family serine peptidase [Wenzhouxiangella marina]AKS41495.1 prolyl oligopeptidase family protein [Wenzhouxiangella marina]MBB6086747.1 dipeptidyl aminopeptidase/acylaminoacyl peptidase [Wenzhouxiangella marina]
MLRVLPSLLLLSILLAVLPLQADDHVERRTANSGNVVMEGVPEIPADIGEQLRRYQNVRSAGLVDWSADGRSIFISTRFAEVNQFHRVDQPGGTRHQLTWFEEPVGAATRRPGHDTLAFLMDQGGNEFSQIFLFHPATGEHEMISDGESRNGGLEWSKDGRYLAFQSTRRNGRSNDLWLIDFEADREARMILESPDGSWWGPAEFSPDGERLLVQQYVSANDSRIHLLDLASGELSRLAGDEAAPSRNLAAGFDAQGDGIYLMSDVGSEFARLTHMDLASGERRVLSGDIEWSISGLEMAPDGASAAVVSNEGGISRMYRLDTASGELSPIENLPIGLIGGLSFSPEGDRLGLVLNNPRSPSDVHVMDWNSGALTRWTYSEVGGLDTERFALPELIEFPSFDEVDGQPRRIPAFVYKPEGEGPHPVVIQIHGGPEGQSRPSFSSTYPMWMDRLGVAVISPNVRGSSGYGKSYLQLDNGFLREDSVRDIGALLDWIAEQPDLDENRVAVFGGSYGGYMVLASAVHYSDRLRAAVDVVGISNFVTFLENTQDYRRDLRRVEYGDERDPEMRAHLEAISPLNHVDRMDVPMFVIQGQNDPRVPVTEAEQIVAALREQGSSVWYMNALNEGHGFRRKENRDLYSEAVVLFFETYLLRD